MRKGEKEAGATRETIRAEELASTLEKLFELMQIGGRMFPSKTVAEMLTAMLYRAVEDERLLEEGLTVEDVADAMRNLFGPSSIRDRSRLNAYLNRLGERGLLEVRSGRPSRYNVRKLLENPSALVNAIRADVESTLKRLEEAYYLHLSELIGHSRLLRRPVLTSLPRYVHEAFLSELSKLDRYSRIMGIALTPTTLVWARPHEEIAGTPVERLKLELMRLMESKNCKLIYFTALTDILRRRLEKGDISLQEAFARASTLYRHLKDERLEGRLIVIDLDVEDLADIIGVEPKWVLEEGRYYGTLAIFALDDEWRIEPESVVVNTLLPSRVVKGKLISEGVVYSGIEAYQKALIAATWLKTAARNHGRFAREGGEILRIHTIGIADLAEEVGELVDELRIRLHPSYLPESLVKFAENYSRNVTIQRLRELLKEIVSALE